MINLAQIGISNAIVAVAGGGSPITYFDSNSVPLDNGEEGGSSPVAITPPASMVAGQLVIITVATSNFLVTPSMSETGGQTWNAMAAIGTSVRARSFWCVFDGTWDANPSVNVGSSPPDLNSVIIHVFTPATGHTTWAVDVAQTSGDVPKVGSVYTIPSKTSTQDDTVTHVVLFTTNGGSITWSSLSGAGWEVTGSNQYRNTNGADATLAFIHNIQTSAGPTGTADYTASSALSITHMSTVFYSS